MSVLVVGGAGFIGSVLVKKLTHLHKRIIVIDKLSLGKLDYLDTKSIDFIHEDINNIDNINKHLVNYGEISEIWHLAANSDIPAGVHDMNIDLKDTFMSTISIIEISKKLGIKKINFSSSSAIYGDLDQELTENIGPLMPISNYGAMKLASEAALSAAFESHLDSVSIYRFPNVVGVPATHGVILDFIRRLKESPDLLKVLGNGEQQKLYLHVNELIDAMFFINHETTEGLNYFNIGPNDKGITVKEIAQIVIDRVAPNASISYQKSKKGWPGDVPKFQYSIEKLKNIGWDSRSTSWDAIKTAVDEIAQQEGF